MTEVVALTGPQGLSVNAVGIEPSAGNLHGQTLRARQRHWSLAQGTEAIDRGDSSEALMRAFLILLLVVLPFFGIAQGTSEWPYTLEETFGKTEREVLAMDRNAWLEFYGGHPGGASTAGMCDAEQIYGTALRRRNDVLFATSSATRRAKIDRLRKHLSEFNTACTELGATFSGGGTLWNIVRSGILPNVEGQVGILAGLPFEAAPPRVTSDVWNLLDTVGRVLVAQRDELDTYEGSGYGYAVGQAELAKARAAFTQVLEIVKTLPRAQSDAFLDACVQRVKTIEFNID